MCNIYGKMFKKPNRWHLIRAAFFECRIRISSTKYSQQNAPRESKQTQSRTVTFTLPTNEFSFSAPCGTYVSLSSCFTSPRVTCSFDGLHGARLVMKFLTWEMCDWSTTTGSNRPTFWNHIFGSRKSFGHWFSDKLRIFKRWSCTSLYSTFSRSFQPWHF